MTGGSFWRGVGSTVGTEISARLRAPVALLQMFALVALCAALTPTPQGRYTILKFGDRVPVMTAETALIAASVVLNLILLGVLGLVLDMGRVRDSRTGLRLLFTTQPGSPAAIGLGRFLANLLFGLIVFAFAGLVLSTTLLARHGALPGAGSVILFLVIGAPAIVAAAILGFVIDLLLPQSPPLRSAAALGLWTAVVMASLVGGFDILGAKALLTLGGSAVSAEQLSLGFVPVKGSALFPWPHAAAGGMAVLRDRSAVAAGLLVLGSLAVCALAGRLHRISARGGARPAAANPGATLAAAPSPLPSRAPNAGVAGPLASALILGRLLVARSPFAALLLAASFVLGITGSAQPGVVFAIVLATALIGVAGTTPADLRLAASIERCEPSLARPSAAVFHTLMTWGAMLAAATPSLVDVGPIQSGTAAAAMLVYASWSIWSHRIADMPLLGVGLAGMVLYVVLFNDVPPEADVLGLWNSSPLALSVAVAAAVAALLWLWKKR